MSKSKPPGPVGQALKNTVVWWLAGHRDKKAAGRQGKPKGKK